MVAMYPQKEKKLVRKPGMKDLVKIIRPGANGSAAIFVSTNKKQATSGADRHRGIRHILDVQDSFEPLSSPKMRANTAETRVIAPRKSIRRNFAFHSVVSFFGSFNVADTAMIATTHNGAWNRKLQRQPGPSANIPPRGAPVPAPVAHMMLR